MGVKGRQGGILFFLLFCAALTGGAAQPKQAETQAKWKTHRDAMGFSVEHPSDWKFRTEPASGRVELEGPAGERAAFWPLFIPGAGFGGERAALILKRLGARLLPGLAWDEPVPAAPSLLRAEGRAEKNSAVILLHWAPAPRAAAACLYLASALEDRFRKAEGIFARILGSFVLKGASEGAETPPFELVPWTDPRERAFSLKVPKGWRINGGLFRFASVDTRPFVEALSPDGKIRVFLGDAELPAFALPDPLLAMSGFPEGSWYSPGYGVRMYVLRYLPGVEFAKWYAAGKAAAGGFSDFALTEGRDRPEIAGVLNESLRQFAMVGARYDAGEAAFTCRQGNQRMQGYCFAGTLLVSPDGVMGNWSVQYLYGCVAAAEEAALAESALTEMAGSFQIDPDWARRQGEQALATSQIVSRTNAEISRMITESHEKRQSGLDELRRRYSNAILGVEDVLDPETGDRFRVESGSSYYWIDHRGFIVGTETATKPGVDFLEMVRIE